MKRSDLNPVDGAVCEHNRYYYNQKKADLVMDEMEKRIMELEKELTEVKDDNSKLRLQLGVK